MKRGELLFSIRYIVMEILVIVKLIVSRGNHNNYIIYFVPGA